MSLCIRVFTTSEHHALPLIVLRSLTVTVAAEHFRAILVCSSIAGPWSVVFASADAASPVAAPPALSVNGPGGGDTSSRRDHPTHGPRSKARSESDLPRRSDVRTLLPTQLELARLVDLAAERLKLRIDYDAGALKGAVTVRVSTVGAGGVTDRELWGLTNSLLASKGFTTVRAPGVRAFSVVKIADAAAVTGIDVGEIAGGAGKEREHTESQISDLKKGQGVERGEKGALNEGPAGANVDVPAATELPASSQPPLPAAPPPWPPPPSPGAAGDAALEEAPEFDPQPGFATRVFRAEHRTAKELAEAVKPLLSKGGGVVTTLGESELFAVSDLSTRLAQVAALLERIDVGQAAPVVMEIRLSHVGPAQVASLVKELMPKKEGPGRVPGELVAQVGAGTVLVVCPAGNEGFWRELVARVDVAQAAETRNYGVKTFAVKDVAGLVEQLIGETGSSGPGSGATVRVVADELTGTLVVTATAERHARVVEILERLDAVPAGAAARVKSFVVRNRPVREVLESLSRLVDAGVLGPGVSDVLPENPSRPVVSANPSLTNVPPNPAVPGAVRAAKEAGGGSVAGNDGSDAENVTSGTRRGPATVRLTADEGLNALIAVGEPRVLTQIEELLKTLDVRQSQVRVEVMLVSMTDSQTRQLGVELDKFGSIDGSAVRLSSIFGAVATPTGLLAAPGIGFTGSVLNPGDFTVLVRAFEAINEGRAMSSPHLLVGNNQQATFTSVSQQPTTTTSTNSSSTTITSFGGFQDAGTKIAVKPQIAEGDHLVLQYDIELSSFTGKGTAGLPAPRQQNSVTSIATIPDGFTVVVGGLELANESTDVQQVPFVGDIPLVGELFKTRTTGNDKTKFWVFIRANVLRDVAFEDLKYASTRDAAKAHVDDGWPKVEPQVVK